MVESSRSSETRPRSEERGEERDFSKITDMAVEENALSLRRRSSRNDRSTREGSKQDNRGYYSFLMGRQRHQQRKTQKTTDVGGRGKGRTGGPNKGGEECWPGGKGWEVGRGLGKRTSKSEEEGKISFFSLREKINRRGAILLKETTKRSEGRNGLKESVKR